MKRGRPPLRFDITALLANQPVPQGRRVGVLTNAGGPGILIADALDRLRPARHRLAAACDTVEKKRTILGQLDQQRALLVEGTADRTYAEALQTIAHADAQDEIAILYREARRTRTETDDGIVGWTVGRQQQGLAARPACRMDHDPRFGACGADADEEPLVGLVEHADVVDSRRADAVAPHGRRPFLAIARHLEGPMAVA